MFLFKIDNVEDVVIQPGAVCVLLKINQPSWVKNNEEVFDFEILTQFGIGEAGSFQSDAMIDEFIEFL